MTVSNAENKPEQPQLQEKTENKVPTPAPENPPAQSASTQKETVEPPEDPNWKAFREARKKDRAEKEAAEKRAMEKDAEVAALKAAMEAAFSKNSTAQNQSPTYPEEETEDQRIEKKVQQAIAQREAAWERSRQEREAQEYPQRLVQTYPDFNNTITPENLDYLEYHYPEVSRPLKRLGDGYDKWADIYLAIKKFVPNNTSSRKEAAKADANFSKPKSISSTGLTQTADTIGGTRLSEDRKAANWARMQ